MLADERGRRVFFEVIREVVDTATLMAVRIERMTIDPELFYLPTGPDWLASSQVATLQEQLIAVYGKGKPSMLQSLERGRPTEIAFINGYVARVARQAGRPAPLNEAVCRLIHEIEAGNRAIGVANLDDLALRL